MALKLYGNLVCPYVQRARIVAMEKNIPMQFVNIPPNEAPPKWFTSINPKGTVPTLNVAGAFITESMRIAEYLDASFPAPHSLFPPRAACRADIREFVQIVDAFAIVGVRALAEPDFKAARPELDMMVRRLDSAMAQHGPGPYFLGTTFSLADVALIPFMDRFRHGFPAFCHYEPFVAAPRLRAFLSEAENRMSFIDTRLSRFDTLRSLEATVGRTCSLPRPVVRVRPGNISDARMWVAAAIGDIDIELRTLTDVALPRLSHSNRDIFDASNGMMMLLESAESSLIPESHLQCAKAHCVVDDAAGLPALLEEASLSDDEGKTARLLEEVAVALRQLMQGEYVLDTTLSFADIALCPIADAAKRLAARRGVPIEVPPTLTALFTEASQKPLVKPTLDRWRTSDASTERAAKW
uniref:GST N-terminal domain-containing protein n=1 Tax=Neobodo designis TaxID=312471 RepID=A0A7S1QF12_NEODS|mmetsp:Transcript_41896/g.129515  ORF Transcript_41896/g.129515 Transcript_41896/m.129515 type:complete len:411 (+) Transcript_41896:170-1402(+)